MKQMAMTADPESRTGLSRDGTPRSILRSMLTALNEGKIAEVVGEFDERFTFTDHGLDLEFTSKANLSEFLMKSRELFPDTMVEILSTFESGDSAMAEWRLTATETVFYGSMQIRLPISLPGVSIAQIQNGKIIGWSDYYDQMKSRRASLATRFRDWNESNPGVDEN
jgi:hypothetical protein